MKKRLLILLAFIGIGVFGQIQNFNLPVKFNSVTEVDSVNYVYGEGDSGIMVKLEMTDIGDLSDITIQQDLEALSTYTGEAMTMIVKDPVRGGIFVKKEVGTVDDTFIYESATTGVWERQITTDTPVNILWNPNVDNTGTAGNVIELLKVYDSAAERGFTKVYHPEGIYYLDSTMVAPPNLHYYGAGKGKTILTFNGNGADYGLQISGSYEEIGEIASIVTNQDDSIQIDANVTLFPHDLIVVSDTIEGSYGISYYREGEFFKVKDSVSLSNVIRLETGVLADGYPIGAKVYKVAKNTVKISDMTLVGNRTVPDEPTNDAFNILLELNLLQDIEVYNVEMSNVNATMFALYANYGGRIYSNDINLTYHLEGGTGSEISKTRHGLISYGSVNLDIFQNNIYANRHATDMADNVRGCTTLGISPCVLSRNINIHDNVLSSEIESAANIHIGEYVTFRNNIIEGGLLLSGNHLQTIGNQISVSNNNNSEPAIQFSSIKGTDILIQDNHISGKNSTVIAQGATAIYARLNWSSDAQLQETDGKIRILNNTIIQEDSEAAIYVVNLRTRPGLEPNLEFSGNKIKNHSAFTNLVGFQGWNVSSTWGSFGDLQIEGNQLNNVELNAIRTNDITVKDNSIKGVNYNALSVTNFDELRAFGNRVNSNLEVGTTAEEESSFYIQDGNLVILDGNEFDSPNNLNQLNVGSVTTLVRGKYHQISGNAGASLTSVTNDLAWEYYFKNITADKFIVRGSTSSSFLVGDGTTRTIVPTDFGVSTSGRILISTGTGDGWGNLSYSSGTGSNTLAQRTGTGGRLKMGSPTESDDGVTLGYANSNLQPLGADLTAIEALSGTGFAKRTGENTWSLDTNTYATTSDLGNFDLQAATDNGNSTDNDVLLDESHLLFSPAYEFTPFNSSIYAGFWYGDFEEEIIGEGTYSTFGFNFRRAGSNETTHTFDFDDSHHQTYHFPQQSDGAPIIAYQSWVKENSGTTVVIPLDDFTLPAMSSPPSQNSFAPIDIVTGELPEDIIDWEITWTDSGFIYKLSALGDYNIQIRESGGKIQIGGQTRSATDYVVDDTTNEPKIIFYVKPE